MCVPSDTPMVRAPGKLPHVPPPPLSPGLHRRAIKRTQRHHICVTATLHRLSEIHADISMMSKCYTDHDDIKDFGDLW